LVARSLDFPDRKMDACIAELWSCHTFTEREVTFQFDLAGEVNATWRTEEIMNRLWSGTNSLKNYFLRAIARGLFSAVAATVLIGSPGLSGQTLTTLYNFGARPGDIFHYSLTRKKEIIQSGTL
jgi:hypothetical protein